MLWMICLTFVAAIIGTISGFGMSTIMVPILAGFLPLPEVLLFVGVIHWFNNLWKVLLFRRGFDWRLLCAFGLPGIVFSFVGASLLLVIHTALLTKILGCFLLLYVAFLFFRPQFRIAKIPRNAIVGGECFRILRWVVWDRWGGAEFFFVNF